MSRSNNKVIGLTFTISRLIGACPFDMRGNYLVSHSKFSELSAIFITGFSLLIRIIDLVRQEDDEEDPRFLIPKLAMVFLVQILLALSCLCHPIQCINNKRYAKHIFGTLPSTGDPPFHICIVIFFIATYIELWRGAFYDYFVGFCLKTTLLLMNLSNSFSIFQFRLIMNNLNVRIHRLSLQIRRKRVYYGEFSKLVQVAKIATKFYQWQILFSVGHIFGYGVVYTFNLVHYIILIRFSAPFRVTEYMVMSILTRLIQMIMIASSCQTFNENTEAFNNELFKLMRENKELCSDSKLFLYVTMRQTVNFTACGFFSLGYPLVTSIIAAATTYLVILLQFSMPSSK